MRMIPLTGISHHALRVKDVERSIRFYLNIVEIELTERGKDGAAYMRRGADHHVLALHPQGSRRPRRPGNDRPDGTRSRRLCRSRPFGGGRRGPDPQGRRGPGPGGGAPSGMSRAAPTGSASATRRATGSRSAPGWTNSSDRRSPTPPSPPSWGTCRSTQKTPRSPSSSTRTCWISASRTRSPAMSSSGCDATRTTTPRRSSKDPPPA